MFQLDLEPVPRPVLLGGAGQGEPDPERLAVVVDRHVVLGHPVAHDLGEYAQLDRSGGLVPVVGDGLGYGELGLVGSQEGGDGDEVRRLLRSCNEVGAELLCHV